MGAQIGDQRELARIVEVDQAEEPLVPVKHRILRYVPSRCRSTRHARHARDPRRPAPVRQSEHSLRCRITHVLPRPPRAPATRRGGPSASPHVEPVVALLDHQQLGTGVQGSDKAGLVGVAVAAPRRDFGRHDHGCLRGRGLSNSMATDPPAPTATAPGTRQQRCSDPPSEVPPRTRCVQPLPEAGERPRQRRDRAQDATQRRKQGQEPERIGGNQEQRHPELQRPGVVPEENQPQHAAGGIGGDPVAAATSGRGAGSASGSDPTE